MDLTTEQQSDLHLAQGYDIFYNSRAGKDLFRVMDEEEKSALNALSNFDETITAQTLVIRYQQRKFAFDIVRNLFKDYSEIKKKLLDMQREEE